MHSAAQRLQALRRQRACTEAPAALPSVPRDRLVTRVCAWRNSDVSFASFRRRLSRRCSRRAARAPIDSSPADVVVTASRTPRPSTQSLADVERDHARGHRAQRRTRRARTAAPQRRRRHHRTGRPRQAHLAVPARHQSNHVLVLIDGVRVGSATSGVVAFAATCRSTQIERIEIVRGPRASSDGSDAIGGVIQIFTRNSKDRASRVRLQQRYGDASRRAGIGHWDGADGYSVQVGARHAQRFLGDESGICNRPDDPYCIYNPDDDGFRNTNLVRAARTRSAASSCRRSILSQPGRSRIRPRQLERASSKSPASNLEGELAQRLEHRLRFGNRREDLDTPDFYSCIRPSQRA